MYKYRWISQANNIKTNALIISETLYPCWLLMYPLAVNCFSVAFVCHSIHPSVSIIEIYPKINHIKFSIVTNCHQSLMAIEDNWLSMDMGGFTNFIVLGTFYYIKQVQLFCNSFQFHTSLLSRCFSYTFLFMIESLFCQIMLL